jgi:catechol 2,3-dioxygenase-like lactoylglutathione lyase family enzyme
MATIDHVTLRVGDLAVARAFYDRVFGLLAFGGDRYAGDPFDEWGDFSIAEADEAHPATEGLHIAFTANSPGLVESWWRELTAAGYSSDGAPGPRPEYSPNYYGAFILDSKGNSIEAVTHEKASESPTGLIDHLWIRVHELEPVKRFYTAIAPALEIEAVDRGERFALVPELGSFTFLEGRPTKNLHLAVGVRDQETVERFHQAALAAGGRDNGAPGERPHYHPGYYGAYVVDPAGTNLEAVFHDRSGLS